MTCSQMEIQVIMDLKEPELRQMQLENVKKRNNVATIQIQKVVNCSISQLFS